MKYGEFSSLVQLGVGLHAGTALLQLYGEIGAQPLIRTLDRIRSVINDAEECEPAETTARRKALADELAQLQNTFDIFRIKLFNEFKKYVIINFTAAGVLVGVLVFISCNFEDPMGDTAAVIITALSVCPAIVTMGVLWAEAVREARPVKGRADLLEDRVEREL